MVEFVNCAHDGKPTPVGVPDGRAAYLIGKAAKASMESGKVSHYATMRRRSGLRLGPAVAKVVDSPHNSYTPFHRDKFPENFPSDRGSVT